MTVFRKIVDLTKTYTKIEEEEPKEGDLFFVEGEFFLMGEHNQYIPVDFVFSVEDESVGI